MGVTAASLLNRLLQSTTRPPKSINKANNKAITSTILTHINSTNLNKAVSLLFSSPFPFPPSIYAQLFHLCTLKLAAVEVRKIESHLITFSDPPSTFLLNRAIETYAKCGCLSDARALFDEMPHRDGGTWNAMIAAYTQAGCAKKALLLFLRMNSSGIAPNEVTFASVLGSCAMILALFLARQIHGLLLKFGFFWNVILGSSLVDIYGKCQVIREARKVFDEISMPNAVSWNVIVRRYLEMGDEKEALVMFFRMIGENVKPLNFTFSNVLVACSSICSLNEGRKVHAIAVKIAFEEDKVVATSLIDMYAKCGVLEDAQWLFDRLGSRNVVSWTSIMSGYAMCGKIDEALELFNGMPERNVVSWNAMLAGYTRLFYWEEALDFVFRMQRSTKDIDHITLGLILNVSTGLSNLELGKQVHGFIYRHGFFPTLFVSNSLLDMYTKCGSLRNAELWFLQMGLHHRDRISWNVLITGYARHGRSEEALKIFDEMQWETSPCEFTFSTVLAACANIFALDEGRQIHGYMIRNGFNMGLVIRGALVDMYSKCRRLEYALTVFKEEESRDLILWNSMILGCAYNGRGIEVLELFELMEEGGVKADNVTFVGVLLACVVEGFVDLGCQYFDNMSDRYGVIPRVEHYECMIELLGKHGFMDKLEDFVHTMPFDPTIAMWTRVFDCCREHGNSKLGELAAQRLNQLNPSPTPARFEIIL